MFPVRREFWAFARIVILIKSLNEKRAGQLKMQLAKLRDNLEEHLEDALADAPPMPSVDPEDSSPERTGCICRSTRHGLLGVWT